MIETLTQLLLPAGHEIGIAQTGIILFATIALGTLLGKIKIKGISLGISAIMFAGILFGHLGYHITPEVSEFLRDLGLMLFVYAIGIQVGPYFFSSFKKEGLTFNLLAVSIVLLGGLVTVALYFVSGISIDNLVGIMSGAVTNTPGLGAAKSVLNDIARVTQQTFSDPTNGYALTYPFGILGVIILMLIGKRLFRINSEHEQQLFLTAVERDNPAPCKVVCRITNQNIVGKTMKEVLTLIKNVSVQISRLKRSGSTIVEIPNNDTIFKERDVVVLVGKKEEVDVVVTVLGRLSTDTMIQSDANTTHRKLIVTNHALEFRTLAQLKVQDVHNVRITRIMRGEIEFVATPTTMLMVGDRITVVGHVEDLTAFEKFVGNIEKKLHEPQLLTISLGIILGAIVGSLPIAIQGLSYPLKLGMAAGPLIVALLISKYSVTVKISPYMHRSALLMLKDFGIALFFATVGLKAGATFYSTLIEYNGIVRILYGSLITFVPLLIMLLVGRLRLNINFLQLVGLMSAAYTDPAALSFSAKYFNSDIPNQSYATVYPLVTITRIIVAQLIVLLLV